MKISKDTAKEIGNKLKVDWEEINLDQFHAGLKVEMEHGSKLSDKTNITNDDLVKTGKIALAHLEELPDYYTRLKKIETNESVLYKERLMKLSGLSTKDENIINKKSQILKNLAFDLALRSGEQNLSIKMIAIQLLKDATKALEEEIDFEEE